MEDIYRKIKGIALTAIFSIDELVDRLVLKGGNAINLIYKIDARASIDLDFSIEDAFEKIDDVGRLFKSSIEKEFSENGYKVFDFKFYKRPKESAEGAPEFWGGYRIEFKLIDKNKNKSGLSAEKKISLSENINKDRRKKFAIDISKYEYCSSKRKEYYEDMLVYVYSPEMLIYEKLRAICQQMPEYLEIIKKDKEGATPRARDFYDIVQIIEILKPEIEKPDNLLVLESIFAAKKVPLALLGEIDSYYDMHYVGFQSLKDTVYDYKGLKEFKYYFDYVVKAAGELKELLDRKSST